MWKVSQIRLPNKAIDKHKPVGIYRNSFAGQKHYLIIQRPKVSLMCVIRDPFLLKYFSLFDKEATLDCPHFPLLFGSPVESLAGKMTEYNWGT